MLSKTLDLEKMQEEFVKTASVTSYKLTKAWSGTLQASGLEKLFKKALMGWPGRGWKGPDTSVASAKLEELVKMTARDLPGLIESQGDPKKLEVVINNWTKWYQGFLREICGIPAKSEAERFAEQWTSFVRSFVGLGPNPAGANFFGIPAPFPVSGSSGSGNDPFRAWMKASERMMQSFFPAAGSQSGTEAGDPIRSAIDAQIRFMNQFLGFQDLLLESSTKAVNKIVDSITKAKIQEITPETYKTLYETLLAQIEGSFSEFLNSDAFAHTLSQAVTSGTEAREKLEGVISDWISFMNLPSSKDMDEIRETMSAMQERIDSLEKQVEELSRRLGELPCKT